MRQRRIKNLEEKYEAYADIICNDPQGMRGSWHELSGGRPVYIEIGCGKGQFISKIAAREPGNFFVAVESNKSVMLRALQKVGKRELDNVRFIQDFARDISEWFDDGEVAGIYLNFSDPFHKNYQFKRRLTYRERLASYFRVLAEDGIVIFKTDNTDFFEWTLREIDAAGFAALDVTRDLHADQQRLDGNIETEYEAKFSGKGETIKRVVIGRKQEQIVRGTGDEKTN